MDSLSAFTLGQAHRDKPLRVFDWDTAAAIIAERKPQYVEAGLRGDMEWTGGAIWSKGAVVPEDDTYTFLASTWATPVLVIDGEEVDCWRYQSDTPDWDAGTYWPDSARALVGTPQKED